MSYAPRWLRRERSGLAETEYLLGSPANAEALLRSLAEARAGQIAASVHWEGDAIWGRATGREGEAVFAAGDTLAEVLDGLARGLAPSEITDAELRALADEVEAEMPDRPEEGDEAIQEAVRRAHEARVAAGAQGARARRARSKRAEEECR